MKYLKLFDNYSEEAPNNRCKLCDDITEDGREMCDDCSILYNESINYQKINILPLIFFLVAIRLLQVLVNRSIIFWIFAI